MNFMKRIQYLLSNKKPLGMKYFDRSSAEAAENVAANGSSSLTVVQLHALLSDAIEKGIGNHPVTIELGYSEGLLCGWPSANIVKAEITTRAYAMFSLYPENVLVKLSRDNFFDAMKLIAVKEGYPDANY